MLDLELLIKTLPKRGYVNHPTRATVYTFFSLYRKFKSDVRHDIVCDNRNTPCIYLAWSIDERNRLILIYTNSLSQIDCLSINRALPRCDNLRTHIDLCRISSKRLEKLPDEGHVKYPTREFIKLVKDYTNKVSTYYGSLDYDDTNTIIAWNKKGTNNINFWGCKQRSETKEISEEDVVKLLTNNDEENGKIESKRLDDSEPRAIRRSQTKKESRRLYSGFEQSYRRQRD